MQRYVEQLVQDIRSATRNIRPPNPVWLNSGADPDSETEAQDMAYPEQFNTAKEASVSVIAGIDTLLLPPADKLTENQKTLLSIELEKLLDVCHIKLDFPENYPNNLRYKIIRSIWNEKVVAMSFGTTHFTLCDYDRSTCPFPGYCEICDEMEMQFKNDEEQSEGGEPPSDPDYDKLLPTSEEVEEWFKKNFPDKLND